ncbi:MAG: hypothetical protein Ct9H300mP4_01710 [Gammaproteobacteria bacterium]|nr:MAG: hypothetical protein Ct9H300mP4_01710 [Gammaproteobacteria bacterium]
MMMMLGESAKAAKLNSSINDPAQRRVPALLGLLFPHGVFVGH